MIIRAFTIKPLIFQSISAVILVLAIANPLHSQNAIDNRENTRSEISATTLLKRGRQKLQRQDYHGAIADLSESILLNPEIADSYYYRGLVRAQIEDQLGAISDFDDAILKNPRHSWAYYHRAGVFFNLGNQSEAILDLQLAAKLFSAEGNTVAYQQTEALLNHFGIELPK